MVIRSETKIEVFAVEGIERRHCLDVRKSSVGLCRLADSDDVETSTVAP